MSTEEMRHRVHVATDTIDVPDPDIEALVARARRSRRTTTRTRLVLAAVAVLVVGVAVTYAVRAAQQPPVVDESELVDGDAQALAALTVEELGVDPEARVVGIADDENRLSVGIVSSGPTGSGDTTWITAGVSRAGSGTSDRAGPCATDPVDCVSLSSDVGAVELTWSRAESFFENQPAIGGTLRLQHVDTTNRVVRSLEYHSTGITGDPRTLDLRFSVEQLADLVTDVRFGFETTQELAGVELPGWEVSPDGSFSPSARELAMSGDVQAIVSRHLGPARVEESSDGHGIDLDLTVDGLPQVDRIHLEPSDGGLSCEPDETGARCARWQVDSGLVTLLWDFESEPDEVAFAIWLQEEDEFQELTWLDTSYPGGDPRTADLPVTVDQLVALLGDLEIEEQ